MDRYLKISFDNVKGRNCEQCMLRFSESENNHCVALKDRPMCPEEGCRKDCPLIENVVDLPVIEANDERYKEVMTYRNSIFADYTRNDYRDLYKTKSDEELYQIIENINKKIDNMKRLYNGLLEKRLACEDILEQIK